MNVDSVKNSGFIDIKDGKVISYCININHIVFVERKSNFHCELNLSDGKFVVVNESVEQVMESIDTANPYIQS